MACLAAYNNGYLHGRWIDALIGADVIQDEINEMLKTSPIPDAEEWALHDYEGFEGLSLSEYEGLRAFARKPSSLKNMAAWVLCWPNISAGIWKKPAQALEDQYAGSYKSLADFAEEITEQTTVIPDALQYYIDYERMGRDMAVNDVFTIEAAFDEIHVFWSR